MTRLPTHKTMNPSLKKSSSSLSQCDEYLLLNDEKTTMQMVHKNRNNIYDGALADCINVAMNS